MQHDSVSSKRRISVTERSRLLTLYHASGLTQAQFAERHRVNVHTLRQWLYRSANVSSSSPKALPPLREVSLSSLLPSAWMAEVVLRSGCVVRLNSVASPEFIAQLFAHLSVPC
jgi:transposase-like protein